MSQYGAQRRTSTEPDYGEYADEILRIIKTTLCRPCTDARKAECAVNLDDPLNCPCCCDRAKVLLDAAKTLKESAQKSS